MDRSRKELEDLLEMATQLGFADDIIHWSKELRKLDKKEGR